MSKCKVHKQINEFELDYLTLAVLKTAVLQSGRMLMDQGGRL